MPNLKAAIEQLEASNGPQRIATNRQAQFGTPSRRYIGAEILPERNVKNNLFREQNIRFRSVIANAGARYSPVQKKGTQLVSSFLVELGESDLGMEFTSEDFDALQGYMDQNDDLDAAAAMVNFMDLVNTGLVEHNEKERWMAIVNSVVTRTGDNGFAETVNYYNPAGHRINASVVWSNNANDPFIDIMLQADLLAGKGYPVRRILVPRPVMTILANNAKVQARVGLPIANVGGTITVAQARATQDAINTALSRDGLPNLETYDLQYRTQQGTAYFLARNVFVMIGATGENTTIDLGDTQNVFNDTLGYVGVGRPAGQSMPGRVLVPEVFRNKPPRVTVDGWMTSLSVIKDPEAIAVIGNIS